MRITHPHRVGLPVLRVSPCTCMPSPLPRRNRWVHLSLGFPSNGGLPHVADGSASASHFSRPAQRSLTLRPACSPITQGDPLHRRLQQLRYLHHCSDCYRLERQVAGRELHPLKTHTFARHTATPALRLATACTGGLRGCRAGRSFSDQQADECQSTKPGHVDEEPVGRWLLHRRPGCGTSPATTF